MLATQHPYLTIEICGGIGSGKSTLAQAITDFYDAQLVPEHFEGNPFLAPYYAQPNSYAFESESYFFLMYLHQQKMLAQQPAKQHRVFDSSRVILAAYYFMMRDDGLLNPIEEKLLNGLLDYLYGCTLPDILLVINCPLHEQMKRIENRNSDFEQNTAPEFFAKHNAALNAALDKFKQIAPSVKIIELDSTNYDFRWAFEETPVQQMLAPFLSRAT
jgi:deoxyguanosine kinase